MHFRQLVAIIYREFVAYSTNVSISFVGPEDIILYSSSLRLRKKGQAETVRCIFKILFGSDPLYQDVADHVATWIRNPESLIGVSILIRYISMGIYFT